MKLRHVATIVALFTTIVAGTFGVTTAGAGAKANGCTIKGTKGPDRLVGTKGRDVICGFAGNDVIFGRGGNDVIRGGKGDDVIRGGAGNDRLLGQPNDDRIYAGPGNDYLDGGQGRNHLFTGPGDNKCVDKVTDIRTPGCDDTAPVVEELTLSDTQIDTSEAARTVTATLHLTDDLAGVQGTPSIEVTYEKTLQRRWVNLKRISGDNLDGTYQGTITLPRFSPKGDWNLHLTVVDTQDNSYYAGPRALAQAGFPSKIEQVGNGDQAGPEFKSFEIDRTSIDTSTAEQTVYFRARVTDVLAGTGTDDSYRPVEVILVNAADSGNQRQANNMQRVSGDNLDGVYEGSMTFPIGSGPATWQIRLGAIDYAGNMTLVSAGELAAKGLPNQIVITG